MKKLLLALSFLATPVLAQQQIPMQCGPSADLYAFISADEYLESRQVNILLDSQTVIEVWANTATGTWTALVSNTTGTSCMFSSGVNYLGVVVELNEEPGTPGTNY